MRIAVDAFGGDNAPHAIIEGCMNSLKSDLDFQLVLVGDEAQILKELGNYNHDRTRIEVVHAPEVIGCDEPPTQAIKAKPNSSMVMALDLVAQRDVDGVVSAGSTGALLTGATFIVKRIRGVKRPALAPILPTANDGHVMLLDSGANADCKPIYLQQFAIMGASYMAGVEGVDNPRVALINNGTEPEKGNELTKAAHALLLQTDINFYGNCEARDILSGDYDVLVCDGFTGNIILKLMEGFSATLLGMLKTELLSTKRSAFGASMCKPAFKSLKKKLDYTEYGGAPLLGVDGCVIKAHGSSDAKAIESAIRQAYAFVDGNVLGIMKNAFDKLPNTED